MILIAGGTGRLGTLVVRRLAARGERVRVLTRDAKRASHLGSDVDVVEGDVRDRWSVARAVSGAGIVVSGVHGFVGPRGISPASVDRDGNAKLTDAAKAAGADLVLLSIVGEAADSPMELFRMKHAALEIGGPENLTLVELAARVQAADGRTLPARHVPPWLLGSMAQTLGRLVPELGRKARAALATDRADLAFDPTPIRRLYPGLPHTSLAEVLRVGAAAAESASHRSAEVVSASTR
jgi:uncharacterized protein YbjT (DUF2867 family)